MANGLQKIKKIEPSHFISFRQVESKYPNQEINFLFSGWPSVSSCQDVFSYSRRVRIDC